MRSVGLFLIFIALLCVGLAQRSSSAQPISPSFSGGTLTSDLTLTAADSPYLITQDITVTSGVQLRLDPGTALHMCPGCSIFVAGEMVAQGTAGQPVTFTHDREGAYWGAMGFVHAGGDNYLGHSVIEYASDALYQGAALHGITARSSTLTIEHSEIRHMLDYAVNAVDATLVLRDSHLFDVAGYEIVEVVRGHAQIERNRIHDGHNLTDGIDFDRQGSAGGLIRGNVIYNQADDCIDLGLGAAPTVEANVVYNCGDKGLSVGEGSDPLVINNLIHHAAIGLASKDDSHPILINNTLVSNSVAISLYANLTPQPGYATVHNSIVWGNDGSIRLGDGAAITVTHSDVQATAVWPGEGNINADPQFWAPAALDFRLRPTSPCVDQADPAVAPATDIRGVGRPFGDGTDVGAFEFFERAWLYLPLVRH